MNRRGWCPSLFAPMQSGDGLLLRVKPRLGVIPAPEARALAAEGDHKRYNIIQLIYHAKHYEGTSKDFEFSRRTMEEHWRAGYHDAVRTLRHPEVLIPPQGGSGVRTFDIARDGRE